MWWVQPPFLISRRRGSVKNLMVLLNKKARKGTALSLGIFNLPRLRTVAHPRRPERDGLSPQSPLPFVPRFGSTPTPNGEKSKTIGCKTAKVTHFLTNHHFRPMFSVVLCGGHAFFSFSPAKVSSPVGMVKTEFLYAHQISPNVYRGLLPNGEEVSHFYPFWMKLKEYIRTAVSLGFIF
jgi:hypothetical protein